MYIYIYILISTFPLGSYRPPDPPPYSGGPRPPETPAVGLPLPGPLRQSILNTGKRPAMLKC